jgi:hypothetical protein
MFAILPPLGFAQVQTFGGVYSDVSLISISPDIDLHAPEDAVVP